MPARLPTWRRCRAGRACTTTRWSGTPDVADDLEIEPVWIFDEHVAHRRTPFDEIAVARDRAYALCLQLRQQRLDVCHVDRHARRARVRHAQAERRLRRALEFHPLDAHAGRQIRRLGVREYGAEGAEL